MSKPVLLFHGSCRRLEILAPNQAFGFGGDADCRKAVYAVAVRAWAIPFALAFAPTAPGASFSVDTESTPPRIRLRHCEVKWREKGYLYTLPADTFEQADDRQWVSYSPVTPLWVDEIDPGDFRDWIEFQTP